MKVAFNLSENYSYDQKQVLRETILAFIKQYSITSMLDIGAGYEDTAVPYSKSVQNYIAVEKKRSHALRLEKNGLNVITGKFPIDMKGHFDLVLSSHSIPEGKVELYKSFLCGAWDLVKPRGWLLIITFKGVYDDIRKIGYEITGKKHAHDEDKYNVMIRILRSLGVVNLDKIVSTERSILVDDLVEVASFSLGLDKASHKNALIEIFSKRLRKGNEYLLPHTHLMFSINKQMI